MYRAPMALLLCAVFAGPLTAQGWKVEHLVTGGDARPHVLGQWGATPAVGPDGVLTYPAQTPEA